jgi:two-component system LytT family response regulator
VTPEVLVVDDEALARSAVVRQLRSVLPDARVREARDGFEALELVRERAPDLLFLDVEMPELSGFDVLAALAPPRPRVVFVTAHAHFAVRAFDESACDYLVKPFTPERFARAVGRAREGLDAEGRLCSLERSLAASGHRLDRLALRRGRGVDLVRAEDIVSLVSEAHYTHVRAGGHVYVTELSLAHLEERLDPARFVRIHRKALVNVRRVARVLLDTVSTDDGEELPLSRRCRGPLLDRLGG